MDDSYLSGANGCGALHDALTQIRADGDVVGRWSVDGDGVHGGNAPC